MQDIYSIGKTIFITITYNRLIRKIVVILLSSEINFNQDDHCRLIEFFKTNNFTKYKYNNKCILFAKLNVKNIGVCSKFSKQA
jgi:hypothetical protein